MEKVRKVRKAPGGPGLPPRWSSSAKSGIGKAMVAISDVSFTISHGILNEVYYPWEDEACTRDMGFLVSDGGSFFSEEKTGTDHAIKMISPGIPAYTLINTCKEKRYRITKEIISDPIRNTVLQRTRFKVLRGQSTAFHLYVLLNPHLGNQGADNTGWVEDYKGVPMLFAHRGNRALALACSFPLLKRSAGFVGYSDGWQDVCRHHGMRWEYSLAPDGNIALTGEIDLAGTGGEFILALGFGHNKFEAAYSARGSLLAGYPETRKRYVGEWRNWQKKLANSKSAAYRTGKLFRISASVLRMHEANRVPGAIIASMSIPWGEMRGDEDTGGYHMVWPRDLVESSGGLLALEAKEDPLRILTYLMTTQEADGHWAQNMWLQGKPHWKGVQMDQTALPILLIDLFRHYRILRPEKMYRCWVTVKRALTFLIQNGPYTEQDRWERDGGLSIFTVAAEVAALTAGADFAEQNKEPELAKYCRETADCWNAHIEDWFYVSKSSFTGRFGVDGYYIRLNHQGVPAEKMKGTYLHVYNHIEGSDKIAAEEMVSPDALALVRFGLRAPDDPRIKNTLKVIDGLLLTETPYGPCWHRYHKDGFGEHEDGSPYDGTGIGRAWPLLTGERGHYEIAAGNFKKAAALVKTMESFAQNGFLPEQIWDTDDIPARELFFGKHTGSAMPLVWAHAEYIKLCRSLKDRRVFDMPLPAQKRYLDNQTGSSLELWRPDHPAGEMEPGKTLRIETTREVVVHWSADSWKTTHDTASVDSGFGIFYTDLPLFGDRVVFTFYEKRSQAWQNKNFEVRVRQPDHPSGSTDTARN